MWFCFGIITLVVGVLASFDMRLAARWKGTTCFHKQGFYELQESRNDEDTTRVRIGISAPDRFNFGVRAERAHDRMFKWLGISTEIQTKDAEFDRMLYVESDARGVAILLKRRPELRKVLIAIFSQAHSRGLRNVRIRCLRGRLWLEYRPKADNVSYFASQTVVPLLYQLRDAISNHQLAARDLHDRFVWRAAAVLALSTSSIVLGGFGLVRSMIGRADILEPWSLFVACAITGVLLAIGALLGIVSWLGGSSRAHIVLIEFALVGIVGFALSSFALGREMNMDLDSSPATSYVLPNIRTEYEVSKRRRDGTRHHYYVHTVEWRPSHSSAYRKLEITAAEYRSLQSATEAVIYVRPGALGFEWIERIQPNWSGPE